MLKQLFENTIIIPFLIALTGVVTYNMGNFSACLIVVGIFTWWLNTKINGKKRTSWIKWNNILGIVYGVCALISPALFFISIVVAYIQSILVDMEWFENLTPAQKQQVLEAERRAREEEKRLYEERIKHERELSARRDEQDRQQAEYQMTHNEFGRPLNPKLPQNAKMLQIHVKYKNGTSGIWQKIGIEHEVRALLEGDQRIESFDLGLLSPMDNGRYPEY